MNKELKRALISVAVAAVVYIVGYLLVGDYGMYYSNEGTVYLAAVVAGGSYWIGSRA